MVQGRKHTAKRPSSRRKSASHHDRGGNGESLDSDLKKVVSQSLDAATYIVFDIETTGGNPERNGITEIAALKVKHGEVIDKFYSLVNPMIPIPPIVRRMTGITNQLVKDAPVIDEIFPDFVEFIADHVLVSHNTTGDLIFLRHFAKDTVGHDLRNFFLCTHLLVEKLVGDAPDKSLKGLSKHFELMGHEFHRAEADANQTRLLFKILLEKLHEKRITKVENAIRLQGDMDSSLRLGWSVPLEKIKNLPHSPGLIYLYDYDRRLVFLSSAVNLSREVARFKQYDLIPRQILKLALRSYDLKGETTGSIFEALIEECEGREKHHLQADPALFHQRQVQVLGLYDDAKNGWRLSVGPIESGLISAFGPVKDRKRALDFIEDLADILGEKVTRNGMLVSVQNRSLIEAVLAGTLMELSRRVESSILRLRIMFWKRDAMIEERRRLDAIISLLGLETAARLPWPDVRSLNGYVIAPALEPSNWTVYGIVCGLPKQTQSLRADDWSEKLAQGRYGKGMLTRLEKQIKSQDKHFKYQPSDLSRLNAVLWWVSFGSLKDSATFIDLVKLKNFEARS